MIYLYKGFTPLQFQYLLFHFAGWTFYCQFAAVELPRPVQSKLKPGCQPRAPQAIFPLGGFWIFSPGLENVRTNVRYILFRSSFMAKSFIFLSEP